MSFPVCTDHGITEMAHIHMGMPLHSIDHQCNLWIANTICPICMHCIVDRNANVADAASPGIRPDAVRIKLESQAFLSQFHFRFAHVWDLVYPVDNVILNVACIIRNKESKVMLFDCEEIFRHLSAPCAPFMRQFPQWMHGFNAALPLAAKAPRWLSISLMNPAIARAMGGTPSATTKSLTKFCSSQSSTMQAVMALRPPGHCCICSWVIAAKGIHARAVSKYCDSGLSVKYTNKVFIRCCGLSTFPAVASSCARNTSNFRAAGLRSKEANEGHSEAYKRSKRHTSAI